MEQEAERLSQWQEAQHQLVQVSPEVSTRAGVGVGGGGGGGMDAGRRGREAHIWGIRSMRDGVGKGVGMGDQGHKSCVIYAINIHRALAALLGAGG